MPTEKNQDSSGLLSPSDSPLCKLGDSISLEAISCECGGQPTYKSSSGEFLKDYI